MSRNTSAIGNIGLVKTLSKFIELGVPVYTPFGEGYTTDLVAEFNGKLNRIQVKTTEVLHENSFMKWRTSRQDGFHGDRKKYTKEEIDYFALYCMETDTLCLVPIDDALTYEVIIRLDNYNGVRTKAMKFVSEYKFENFIKN